MTPRPRHPTDRWNRQFTLRGLFRWIFILGVMLGVGRWVYVRTILQRQVATQLRNLDIALGYRFLIWPHNNESYRDREPTPPVGYVADDVSLGVPFASEAEAKRVNGLLHQLPYLRRIVVQTSRRHYRQSTAKEDCDRHAAMALAGLAIDELGIRSIEVGPELAQFVRNSPSLRRLSVGMTPPLEHLQTICQLPQLEVLQLHSAITAEEVNVLAASKQLKTLSLSRPGDYSQLSPLRGLENCSLRVNAHDATDQEILESLATLPNLTDLSLFMTVVSDEAATALAAAPRLQRLSLECAFISDSAVVSLATSASLQNVDLSGTDVSEETIVLLAQAPAMRTIRVPERIDVLAMKPHVPAAVELGSGTTMHEAGRALKLAAIEQEQAAASADAARAPK